MGNETITRTLRVELGGSPHGPERADIVYDALRDLRSISHRMLNAGIVGAMVDYRAGDKPHPLSHIKRSIEEHRAYSAEQIDRLESAENAARVRLDKAEASYARKQTDKNLDKVTSANDAHVKALGSVMRARRNAALYVPASITDACQQKCNQALKKFYKAKGSERLPSFRFGAPIFIRDGAWSISKGKRGFELALKLTAERPAHTAVRVVASKGTHWARLRDMVENAATIKLGDCKVIYDDRRKKWYALLSYTTARPVARSVDSSQVYAVNRGRRQFLYGMSSTGSAGRILDEGGYILEVKQRVGARRKSARAHLYGVGAGARGHGKKRRYKLYEHLSDYEARFVKTACQQYAAEAVSRAKHAGCGTIAIEDFSRIDSEDLRYIPSWPWYQLKEAIVWAAKREGLETIEIASSYISQTCPRCERVDPAQHNHRTGVFHCKNPVCGFERDADWVAVFHMLRRSGAPMDEWEKRFEQERKIAKRLLEAAE